MCPVRPGYQPGWTVDEARAAVTSTSARPPLPPGGGQSKIGGVWLNPIAATPAAIATSIVTSIASVGATVRRFPVRTVLLLGGELVRGRPPRLRACACPSPARLRGGRGSRDYELARPCARATADARAMRVSERVRCRRPPARVTRCFAISLVRPWCAAGLPGSRTSRRARNQSRTSRQPLPLRSRFHREAPDAALPLGRRPARGCRWVR